MPRKPIGDASDFYRVRLLHVDDADLPELDWRDDILWRRPPSESIDEFEMWRVEAVAIDNEDDATVIGMFDNADDAHEALTAAEDDLAELTRSQFEERYFPADV